MERICRSRQIDPCEVIAVIGAVMLHLRVSTAGLVPGRYEFTLAKLS